MATPSCNSISSVVAFTDFGNAFDHLSLVIVISENNCLIEMSNFDDASTQINSPSSRFLVESFYF